MSALVDSVKTESEGAEELSGIAQTEIPNVSAQVDSVKTESEGAEELTGTAQTEIPNMSAQVDSVKTEREGAEKLTCTAKTDMGIKDNDSKMKPKKRSKKSKCSGSKDLKKRKKIAKSKKHKMSKSCDDSFTGFLHECNLCSNLYFPSDLRLAEHMSKVHGVQISRQKSSISQVDMVEDKSSISQVDVVEVSPVIEQKPLLEMQESQKDSTLDDFHTNSPVLVQKPIPKIKESQEDSALNDFHSDLKCNSCHAYFSTEEKLNNHLEIMHKDLCEAVAACPCCTTDVRSFNPHVRNIETQTQNSYNCNDCDDWFEEETDLLWHRLKKHKIVPLPVQVSHLRKPGRPRKAQLKCEVCSKLFRTRRDMINHQDIHKKDQEIVKFELVDENECGNVNPTPLETQLGTFETLPSEPTCDISSKVKEHLKIHTTEYEDTNLDTRSVQKNCTKLNNTNPQNSEINVHCTETQFENYSADQKCNVCSEVLKSLEDIREHQRLHSTTKRVEQPETKPDTVPSVSDNGHEYNDVNSTLADKETLSTSKVFKSLKEHLKKYTFDAKEYEETKLDTRSVKNNCTKLDYTNPQNSEINVHVTDTPFENYSADPKCNVCSEVLKSLEDIKEHQRLHSTTKKVEQPKTKVDYTCKNCHFKSVDEASYEKHTCIPQVYACSECGKLFNNVKLLQVHFRWHDLKQKEMMREQAVQDRKFICEVCGISYGRKSHLNVHLKRHAGKKSYCCQYCDKKFYTAHNLKIHQWTHTGEKHYICTHDGCYRRFTQKSHLTYHNKTHKKHQGQADIPQVKPQEKICSGTDNQNNDSQHQESSEVNIGEKKSQENVQEHEARPQEVRYEEVQTEVVMMEENLNLPSRGFFRVDFYLEI